MVLTDGSSCFDFGIVVSRGKKPLNIQAKLGRVSEACEKHFSKSIPSEANWSIFGDVSL
jgi:hypothetical protein